jgi:hypothetical protein
MTWTASNLQSSRQDPHFVQISELMTWTCFFSPRMATTGQFFAQTMQPVHFSAEIR